MAGGVGEEPTRAKRHFWRTTNFMKCFTCKQEISAGQSMVILGVHYHRGPCPPKAERSEALPGCPPSATGSADARASDESGADSSGRSADKAVLAELAKQWRRRREEYYRASKRLWWWPPTSRQARMAAAAFGVCAMELERTLQGQTLTAERERACLPNAALSEAADR